MRRTGVTARVRNPRLRLLNLLLRAVKEVLALRSERSRGIGAIASWEQPSESFLVQGVWETETSQSSPPSRWDKKSNASLDGCVSFCREPHFVVRVSGKPKPTVLGFPHFRTSPDDQKTTGFFRGLARHSGLELQTSADTR